MRISKKVSLVGVWAALAVVLAILEQYVPIHAVLPLPGIKLGIANVVSLVVLNKLDFKSALAILFIRCAIVSLLFGTPVSFLMSLSGGLFSLCVMCLLLKGKKFFSVYGVSVAGAACHNIGQVICAAFVLKSVYVVAYLPILLLSSFLTGTLIGVLAAGCLKVFDKNL